MRAAELTRKTRETDIYVKIDLDGNGKTDISTGIGFFDHMLTALGVHSGFDLTVKAEGDLYVDAHHTVEDTGIVLGQAFKLAIGDMSGIERYGSAYIPMDEALGFACVDISNRPFLVFDANFNDDRTGQFDNCLTEEFLRAFAFNAGLTLHVLEKYGRNDHHIIEALFKACAHALKIAAKQNGGAVLSTKGVL